MREEKYRSMFTELENQVFYILRQALFGDGDALGIQPELLANANWNQIYEEMQAQTVTALSADWITEQPFIDEATKTKWSMSSILTVRRWLETMSRQEKLTDLLKSNGIDFAILKGSAAAIYYPHPEYRVMGDIDFIVRKEDVIRVHQLMLENGYQDYVKDTSAVSNMAEKHHDVMVMDGMEYELHWTLALERQEKRIEDKLQEWLERGINESEENMIEDVHVRMFPWALNGLVLLRHMMQHVQAKNMGLRQIIDWMMFVNTHLDDKAWNDTFQEMAVAAGLETLAIHATRACQLHLGLREDGISWCLHADPQLSEELLKSIMSVGNYGMKTSEKERGFSLVVQSKTIFSLIKPLQLIGLEHWQMAQKYPVLRPFAWVYQIGRWASKKNNPVKASLNLIKDRHDYKDMLEQLGIGWDSDTK